MRILLALGDAPWPPTTGGQLRDGTIVSALAAFADLTVVLHPFRETPAAPLPFPAEIRPRPLPSGVIGRSRLRASAVLHRRHPFQQHFADAATLRAWADTIRAVAPDVCVIGYPLFHGFPDVARAAGHPVVVDLTELREPAIRRRLASSPDLAGRVRAGLDLFAVRSVEAQAVGRADAVWVVGDDDAAALRKRTKARVDVVPNTIRVAEYARFESVARESRALGFLGAFDHEPNRIAAVRLARRILPLVRSTYADARLVLIGRRPPESLRALASSTAGVELVAGAPDAVGRLARTGLLVAPLEAGTGTKLKILEAAASGIPVITTAIGRDGLAFRVGEEILEADTDAEFAAAIVRLWSDPGEAGRLAVAARRRVEAMYDVRVAHARIRESIGRVVGT